MIDAKTNLDVTKTCLIQIIFELEATENPFFTREILENIVRFHSNPMHAMMKDYFETASRLFKQR